MQLGASLPVGDIGTGPSVLRDYAQAAEGLGYDYLVAPDHVLGANPAADHGGRRIGTSATAYHDPFVLFGFLAGITQKIGFAAGVLILAQRQAALVAKQAACLDALSEGRFRLGVGVGWNEIEFQGLGADFRTRGKRSEEQVRFMQALWAEPAVTFAGEFHHLDDGGINPRPKSGRVPIWFGGHIRRWLHAARLSGGRRGPRGIRKAARDDPRRGPRSRIGGAGGLGFARHRRGGRLAARDRLLEEGGSDACQRAHQLRERAPQAHRRQEFRRPSHRDYPLSRSGGRSALVTGT